MLAIWGGKTGRSCDGISRRDFLRVGALGGALSLADLFRLQAAAAPGAAPRPARPNKSVIMVYLLGGPAQLDTYDLKPDAPAEYRGEFKPIRTRVSGIDICELFPRQAALMDKMTILRSLSATAPNGHSDAEVLTGRSEVVSARGQHPCMGSVISRARGMSASGVPPYVTLRKMSFPTATPLPTMLFYLQPGFLGPAHLPLSLSGSVDDLGTGPAVADLQLPAGVGPSRLEDRRQLLAHFDTLRRDLDASGAMSSLDAFQGRALEVVTSRALRDALDVSKEPLSVRERYGSARGYHAQGTQMLLARRLIEAGVGFVEVALGYWDTHGPANVLGFPKMREKLCPTLDQSLSALVEDLHVRGLAQDVVVIVWGEFGRSPRISKDAGRDHWLPAMSAVIAGGGLKMGQVIGSTDARGEFPKDRPYKISNVLSTIYRAIGIDPALTFRDGTGRPRHLLDERAPVRELL
jgi:uncharacterized protein (DUF1501 family)